MKLLHLDPRNKIATVECWCGGQTLIPTWPPSAAPIGAEHSAMPICGILQAFPWLFCRFSPQRPLRSNRESVH
jgi:hypothetical protein